MYSSGFPCPHPGDHPNPEIKLVSLTSHLLHWQVGSLQLLSPEENTLNLPFYFILFYFIFWIFPFKREWSVHWGFPGGDSGKKIPAFQCRRCKSCGFNLWVKKIPWRRACQPTLVFLPAESHWQRSLAGYSPMGSHRVRHDWNSLAWMHIWIVHSLFLMDHGYCFKNYLMTKLLEVRILKYSTF